MQAQSPSHITSGLQTMSRKETRKPGRLSFAWPVRGRLTSRFGRRDGRLHEGIDMAAHRGTTSRAAESAEKSKRRAAKAE